MGEHRRTDPEAAALAALSIAESLILSLVEGGMMARKEIEGMLEDAAVSHRCAAREGCEPELNSSAAQAIDAIRQSVRLLERRRDSRER